MAQFVIRNSIGSIVDHKEAEGADHALIRYAVGINLPSSYLRGMGYHAEPVMPIQRTIDGINFEVWEKSFRVSHDAVAGPVHFIGDTLDDAMSKVADVVKAARRRQHERDTEALTRLADPELLE